MGHELSGNSCSFVDSFGQMQACNKYLPISFCVPVQLRTLAAQGFSITGNTISNWDIDKGMGTCAGISRSSVIRYDALCQICEADT